MIKGTFVLTSAYLTGTEGGRLVTKLGGGRLVTILGEDLSVPPGQDLEVARVLSLV